MNDDETTRALTVRDDAGELSIEALAGRMQKIRAALKSVLVEGSDYGRLGGKPKPSLFQPGAQKLALLSGLAPRFRVERSDMADGHREERVTCTLRHRATGVDVGEGIGLCTTLESKYRYRNGAENPNIADTYNIVAKMAAKRAFVAAVLTAVGASDLLTQDLEDLGDDEGTRAAPARQRRPAPAQEATAEIDDSWALAVLGDIDSAATVDELKAIAPKINSMPKGSAARRSCRLRYDQRMAKLS